MRPLVLSLQQFSVHWRQMKRHSKHTGWASRRFGHPADCEVICLVQAQLYAACGTMGKSLLIFRNRVKPGIEKDSTFVLTQISRITPFVSRRMRGVGHRHERAVRCDGRKSCD